jgi:hypothetical protein
VKYFEQLLNMTKLYSFSIKRDKAISECIKNNIPLTNENIFEVRQLINGRVKEQTQSANSPQKK